MMFNYPCFGFPPYYRRFYPKNTHTVPITKTEQEYIYNTPSRVSAVRNNSFKSNAIAQNKSVYNTEKSENISFKNQNEENRNCIGKEDDKKNNEVDAPLFDLFGLKLYFDDILLLGLLFVLYSEGVDDTNLYIALVLLLMS